MVCTTGKQLRRTHIDGLPQGLAGFEVRYTLFRDGDAFTTARIAPDPWRASVNRKTAKSANLDAMPPHQRFVHGIQYGFDREFSIAVCQLAETAGKFFYEVRARHGCSFLRRKSPRTHRAHSGFAGKGILADYLSEVSSLARSKAPKLVVPAFSRADCWLNVAMASL